MSQTKLLQREILLDAYATLDRTTPLTVDCGLLCKQSCCRGDDDAGMLLLPGEADLLAGEEGYRFLSNDDATLLICSGSCNRSRRPFACRIFPLFPLVSCDADGRYSIRLILDPRGYSLCPLARSGLPLRGIFRYLVRRATRVLLQDHDIASWLLEHSAFITALEDIRLTHRHHL